MAMYDHNVCISFQLFLQNICLINKKMQHSYESKEEMMHADGTPKYSMATVSATTAAAGTAASNSPVNSTPLYSSSSASASNQSLQQHQLKPQPQFL